MLVHVPRRCVRPRHDARGVEARDRDPLADEWLDGPRRGWGETGRLELRQHEGVLQGDDITGQVRSIARGVRRKMARAAGK